ncbi:NAD-dependent epimerase/dehydratase family protein [Paenibacillus alvei]|uniref:NAD-dependent epimerase/dehydratase family protein n=1 Tax=Paenibacillus alvei TaxID=44250 RepID=UPI000385AE53|nr:NAD-dependent epimerase/dehydratase family protein [Paenibacillus alvei]EPY09447.1 NAD-dependent epimerase/dehydratase [Paenibacillus alvei A6-6i-x]
MRIIVTGGAGFIGSHIVDELVLLGHEVSIIDNFSTGRKSNVNQGSKLFVEDINSDAIFNIFNEVRPHIVFHLAAQVSVEKSIRDVVYDEGENIRGTINILEACKKYEVKKIVYSSSAAIYGCPITNPIKEIHPLEPISFYGISKLTPEYYIRTYSKLYGMDHVILRYSNVYGPRQDYKGEGGVISLFMNKVKNNESPVIYGDGLQTRDFIYVKDVASANICALQHKENETFNISTNYSKSIKDIIDIMSTISNKEIMVKYTEARKGDIFHSRLDNSLACERLNWQPRIALEDGIRKLFEHELIISENMED